jgi:hypothetical protein
MNSFFRELKQRKVYRVSLGYSSRAIISAIAAVSLFVPLVPAEQPPSPGNPADAGAT